MWHFCLAVDLLHLCAERGFDTSQGSYVLLKWPLGQARDQKKNLRPGLHLLAFPPPSSWACASRKYHSVLVQGKDLSPSESKDPDHDPYPVTHWLCVLG